MLIIDLAFAFLAFALGLLVLAVAYNIYTDTKK